MREYDKRTVYLDLKKDGMVVCNSGFAKIIVQNGQMRLTVNVSDLHNTDILDTNIVFVKGKVHIPIDALHIKGGRSVYSRLIAPDELKSMGVEWNKIYSILIKLDDRRVLEAVINPDALNCAEENNEVKDVEKVETVKNDEENKKVEAVKNVEDLIEVEDIKEAEEIVRDVGMLEAEMVKAGEQIEEVEINKDKIYEDKWRQLESSFPHVHPFGDSREFLSVKPKDFVVLTKEYQPLAGNSFLLHGFYNYNHVILGKMNVNFNGNIAGENYYIGVPGVYYEREKAVAVMFGFDSFECNREPATTGTFGYYMKKVEI